MHNEHNEASAAQKDLTLALMGWADLGVSEQQSEMEEAFLRSQTKASG